MWSARRLNFVSRLVQQTFGTPRTGRRALHKSSKRQGGGHDAHSHNQHSNEPYAVKHHPTYPNEAFLFGIDPSKPYKSEGWELLTFFTYISCFCIIAFSTTPTDSFVGWARDEAIARKKVIENGGTIEFGKYYNVVSFKNNDDDEHAMPLVKEGDE